MSNVIQFKPEKPRSALPRRRSAREFTLYSLRATAGALRHAVFYVLMWLRGPVRFVCGAVAGLGVLAVVLMYLMKPNETMMMWQLAGASFTAFLIGWLYDSVLLKVSPEPIFLDCR